MPPVDDEPFRLCQTWLRLRTQADALQVQWSTLEHQLSVGAAFYHLSEAERHALPQAQALYDLDARIEALHNEMEAALRRLPLLKAKDCRTVIAKLCVARKLMAPEDHPEAHQLMAGSINDLLALCNLKTLAELQL